MNLSLAMNDKSREKKWGLNLLGKTEKILMHLLNNLILKSSLISIMYFIISLFLSSRTTQKLPYYCLGTPSLFIAILQICKDPKFLKISHITIFKIIENLLEFYLTPLRKFLLVLIGFLGNE